MSSIPIGLLATAAIAAVPASALACRCREPSIDSAVRTAQAAVVGEVLSSAGIGSNAYDYTIAVKWAWGSADTGVVTVRSQGMCMFRMNRGEAYILFLRHTPPGIVQTSVCMGNKSSAEMQPTIALLNRRYGRPKTGTASVSRR